MNKKFKELANKAGFTHCTAKMQELLTAYGTLIVCESAAIIPESAGDDRGTYRDQLTEHFGIDNEQQ